MHFTVGSLMFMCLRLFFDRLLWQQIWGWDGHKKETTNPDFQININVIRIDHRPLKQAFRRKEILSLSVNVRSHCFVVVLSSFLRNGLRSRTFVSRHSCINQETIVTMKTKFSLLGAIGIISRYQYIQCHCGMEVRFRKRRNRRSPLLRIRKLSKLFSSCLRWDRI